MTQFWNLVKWLSSCNDKVNRPENDISLTAIGKNYQIQTQFQPINVCFQGLGTMEIVYSEHYGTLPKFPRVESNTSKCKIVLLNLK